MVSLKDKRHSGRTSGMPTIKAPKKEIINNCLEPHEFYDDWGDYRDGFRAYHKDRTKIKDKDIFRFKSFCGSCAMMEQNNKKLKRLEKIRQARKDVRLDEIFDVCANCGMTLAGFVYYDYGNIKLCHFCKNKEVYRR